MGRLVFGSFALFPFMLHSFLTCSLRVLLFDYPVPGMFPLRCF